MLSRAGIKLAIGCAVPKLSFLLFLINQSVNHSINQSIQSRFHDKSLTEFSAPPSTFDLMFLRFIKTNAAKTNCSIINSIHLLHIQWTIHSYIILTLGNSFLWLYKPKTFNWKHLIHSTIVVTLRSSGWLTRWTIPKATNVRDGGGKFWNFQSRMVSWFGLCVI